jgi:hypothetical protein
LLITVAYTFKNSYCCSASPYRSSNDIAKNIVSVDRTHVYTIFYTSLYLQYLLLFVIMLIEIEGKNYAKQRTNTGSIVEQNSEFYLLKDNYF